MLDTVLMLIGFAFLALITFGLLVWLYENLETILVVLIVGAFVVAAGVLAFIFAGPGPGLSSSSLLTIFVVWWMLNNNKQRS